MYVSDALAIGLVSSSSNGLAVGDDAKQNCSKKGKHESAEDDWRENMVNLQGDGCDHAPLGMFAYLYTGLPSS